MGPLAFSGSGDDGIRSPVVAGTFYPADAEELRREVWQYLQLAHTAQVESPIVGAVAPHAGYRYSADVAAHVHKAIRDVPFDTLVVIGHDSHAHGVVAILPRAKSFATPLGEVPVDTELAEALTKHNKRIIFHDPSHARDHTIEVQLPFIQVLGRRCRVLPILFGQPSVEHVAALAEALQECKGTRRLFVLASSDLSHYPTDELARELDAETLSKVEELDLAGLLAHVEAHHSGKHGVQTAMCASGGVGTAMLLAMAEGDVEFQLLKAANSGDASGDKNRVVGYAAGVFVRKGQSPGPEPEEAFALSQEVCVELLDLARSRIEAGTAGQRLDYRPPDSMLGVLGQPAAVFVTLHESGQLRGCIGTTVAREPLWQAVYGMAQSAAFRDPRFPAVTAEEVPDLRIGISVLSAARLVQSPDEIVPMEHGVIVRRGDRSGLFLPQVWDQLPDKESFLTILCQQKAHLPGNAWQDGTAELSVFTVFAFEEVDE